MMKSLIKKNKGVSLISLVITVAVILILTNVVVYNAADSLRTTKLSNMQADIENLRDKVSTYYAQYGMIPADTSVEYTNTSHISSISEATDIGPFYVIDLAAMENVTLNYGRDYEKIRSGEVTTQEQVNQLTDLYIINGTSHNVFYVAGIESGDETFYTDYSAEDTDKVDADLRYYDGVEIPDGFYYVGGTKDTGLVISDVQGDDLDNSKQGNQFVWIPVENESDYVRNRTYRNVDTSLASYTDTGYLPDGIQPDTDEAAYNEEAEKQAVMMAKGFFVSRFEAGKEGSDTLVSKKGATVWSNITQEASKSTAKTFVNNDSVKSALISGTQWDMIMKFVDGKLDGNGNIFYVEQADSENRHTEKANSGNNEADKVCNIYDLEANHREFIAEKNNFFATAVYNYRGGSYSNEMEASWCSGLGEAGNATSFRFILYVIPRDNWTPAYDETTTYTDKNGDTATIPQGFSVSRKPNEKTIDDGLVVKDEDGNEFVWVPVDDINTMAQCSTAGGNCNLELEEDILKCTTHNSEEIVGKLYATTYGEYFGTVNTTYNTNSGLREPAIVTGNSTGTGTTYDGNQDNLNILGYSSSTEMLNDLKTQYKEMATSVAKNRGFYVGRYELGLDTENNNVPVSKNASTTSGVTTVYESNSDAWYRLCKKCKEYTVEASVVSTMIWGSQYDAMMNWMQNNGVDVTSTGTVNNTGITGSNLSDVIKNIYDLYGSYYEWTLEANETRIRVIRGSSYAENNSPSYRFGRTPNYSYSGCSARLTLYVK